MTEQKCPKCGGERTNHFSVMPGDYAGDFVSVRSKPHEQQECRKCGLPCKHWGDWSALTAENKLLRAALANSELPCVYCSLPASDMAKCESGFPGCERAEDALGCPHLGASLKLDELTAENAQLREQCRQQQLILDTRSGDAD